MRLAGVLLVGALAASCANPGPKLRPDDDFEHADPNRPPTADTLRAMARLFSAQGREEDCERTLVRLLEEHPDCAPAYNDLADLHLRNGRIQEAIATLEAGLAQAPSDAVLLNNLGLCELQRGSPERALERFTSAVTAAPGDARCRANMALALGLIGRLDESLALYLQVVPEADAHDNLAIVCKSRGDAEGEQRERMRAAQLRSAGH